MEAIDLWCIPLGSQDDLAKDEELLNDAERARAARLAPRLRADFVRTRGTVRQILGRYADRDPARLEFQTTERGKPSVANSSIGFSIAHSTGLALLVLVPGHDVGVDLELIRPVERASAIAERYFSAQEAKHAPEHFLQSWTLREALLKAAGTGIAALSETRALDLSGAAGGCEIPAWFQGQDWWLRAIAPAPGYLGAIAVDAPDLPVVSRCAEEVL